MCFYLILEHASRFLIRLGSAYVRQLHLLLQYNASKPYWEFTRAPMPFGKVRRYISPAIISDEGACLKIIK